MTMIVRRQSRFLTRYFFKFRNNLRKLLLPVPVSAGSMAGPCRSSRSPTRDTRDFGESVDARSDAGKADSENPGRIKNFNRYDVKIIK
jgi:hypothetical protein